MWFVVAYSNQASHYQLSAQLQLLGTKFIEFDEKTIPGIIKYKKKYSGEEREFFSEITILLRFYLLSPATKAVSETGYAAQWHRNS